MKKILPWIIGLLFLLLFGCSNDEDVADELIDYHNNDWLTAQRMKEEHVGASTSELIEIEHEGTEEQAVRFIKNELVPDMEEVLDYLARIELENSKVIELHELHLHAEEQFYEWLHSGISYYQGELDEDDLGIRSQKVEEAYEEFIENRDHLMKKYGIVWEEGSYDRGYDKMKIEAD